MTTPTAPDLHWAPKTRSLVDELPTLTKRLHDTGFEVFRVMFNLTEWPETPRRTIIGGRTIKLGGFVSQPRDVVTVIDGSGRNRLQVVNDG